MTQYQILSSKYKLKFFNFILKDFLNKYGGYNIDHDDMVYKLSNFGAKVKSNYISFTFGVKQEDINILIDMLSSYDIFDIKQLQTNIVQIYLPFNQDRIRSLKYKRFGSQSQKQMKQLVLNCYRKMKDITEQNQDVI